MPTAVVAADTTVPNGQQKNRVREAARKDLVALVDSTTKKKRRGPPLLKGSKMIDGRTKHAKAVRVEMNTLRKRDLAARAALGRFRGDASNNDTTDVLARKAATETPSPSSASSDKAVRQVDAANCDETTGKGKSSNRLSRTSPRSDADENAFNRNDKSSSNSNDKEAQAKLTTKKAKTI